MTSQTRRALVHTLGLGLAASLAPTLAGAKDKTFFAGHKLDFGVELYSLGELMRTDMAASLKALAAVGYRTTEIAGYQGNTPAAIRKAHDDAGLKCISAHVQVSAGKPEEPGLEGDIGQLADHMHILGVKHALVPGFPLPKDITLKPNPGEGAAFSDRQAGALTAEHWKARAAFLNDLGKKLKPHGLRTGYHNHARDFLPFAKGGNGVEVLLKETDPALVDFEMDIGWAVVAGQDPLALLKAHHRRFSMFHVKDMKPNGQPGGFSSTEVGAGTIAWQPILRAAYADGGRTFFVEQEPPFVLPRLEALSRSAAYLKALPM
ncbi:sugar phosphate isomerase/epimerase [soil metagenome]